MIRYGLTSEDGSVIAEAAFSREKLESAPLIFYCDWSGPLDGSCRMYRPIAENDWSLDDTTIIINVKED